jgi:hypothetical protein
MCASAVAGSVDLLDEKETNLCFAYYGIFLIVFAMLTQFYAPGKWAMYVHDQAGNAALLFFLLYWGLKDGRRQLFVCLLIGGQVLSAYTHMFDVIFLHIAGYVPEGMWRPHNIMHTPLAGFLIPLAVLPLARLVFRRAGILGCYFMMTLGYFLHIFADTVTYDYQVYVFWPFSGWSFTLISVFQRPDIISSAFLGNPLYIFEKSTAENVDGFIVYRAEVAVNIFLAALFYVKAIVKRVLAAGTKNG